MRSWFWSEGYSALPETQLDHSEVLKSFLSYAFRYAFNRLFGTGPHLDGITNVLTVKEYCTVLHRT